MRLNENSWHARLYKVFYDVDAEYELPRNLCDYFWRLVLALILTPLYFISLILRIPNYTDPDGDSFRASLKGYFSLIIFQIVISALIGLIASVCYPYYDHGFGILASFGLGVSTIFAFAIVIYIIYKISRKLKEKKQNKLPKERKSFKDTIVYQWFKAKKERYCPTIKWSNYDETN